MDVIDAVATRVAVNRAKSRLTSRFAGAVTPVSGTVIGEGLALVNGQLVNAAVSESQIGETLSLQNAGRAAAAVYVPTAGAGGVAAASSGGGVASVPSASMIPHDLGGSFHIGELRSDQATWALMVDGSRMLMGDLAVYAGVMVDGVDLDVHVADPAAHHDPVTVGGGMLLSGQQVSVGAGYGIQVNANNVQLASSVAGAGLTYSTGVVAVGAGYGIQVNTDDVQLAPSVAGAGLTYMNGVLAVGAGVLVTVGADSVGITDGSSYQFIGTGGGVSAAWQNLSSLAGDGLTHSAGVLAVGVANTGAAGLSVEADAVRLTSSHDPGPNRRVLASDGSGWTTLVGLKATDRLRAPLIDTASGDLTISPLEDLMLAPASNLVKLPSGKAIQSDGYQSQIQGMRVTSGGAGDFRYLFVDEMHAKSFITDLEQALAGGQIISKSVAVVAEAFTLPAGGGYEYVTFKDFPSALGMQVFQLNDWVAFRTFNRQNNQLEVGWAWGQVTAPVDNQDGTQTWTWTRNDVTPGLASGTIAADAIALDLGVSGSGFYEVNAIDGQYAENSPYWRVVTWSGHPATQTVRVQGGNLRGLFGSANDYGFYAGSGVGNSDAYLRLSQLGNELRNIPIRLYNSGALTTVLDSSSGLSFDLNQYSYNGILWSDNLAGGGHTISSIKMDYQSLSTSLLTNVRTYDGGQNAVYNLYCLNTVTGRSAMFDVTSGNNFTGWSGIYMIADHITFGTTPKMASGGTFWTADNDGAGSLLDADKLDGQQGSYYLAASSYTASDVLTKVKTVDGPSSGLNADLLDNQEGSYYLAASTYTAADVLTKIKTVDGPSSGLNADLLDNQDSSYYLAASSYTAADALAKIKTVDGSGSGLDADTIDTVDSSRIVFGQGAMASTQKTDINWNAKSGFYSKTPGSSGGGAPSDNYYHVIEATYYADSYYMMQLAQGFWDDALYHRIATNSSGNKSFGSWRRIADDVSLANGSHASARFTTSLLVDQANGALGSWANATMGTGWANYGGGYVSARYRRFGDVVHVHGMVYCTNASYGGILNLPYQIAARYIYQPASSVQHCRVDAVPYSGYTGIQVVGTPVFNQWIMLDMIIPIY